METFEIGRATTIVAVLAASLLVWFFFLQWEKARRFFLGRPIAGALIEAMLIIGIAYSVHKIFNLLGFLPRLLDWAELFRLCGQVTFFIGAAMAIARLFEGILAKRHAETSNWRMPALSRIAFYGIFVLAGLVTFLVADGRTPKELFVWTGATAAVLAFVMQQTLGDLFSGLSLTIEGPFKIGDWLRLEDGTEGQVEDINWRATRLRKWDKTVFVIPNGRIARESFINLSGSQYIFAPWYSVKVSNDHPPSLIIALLEQAVRGCDIPMRDPAPVARILDASTTPYTYMVWVQFSNYPMMFAGRSEVYTAIDETLRGAGIEISANIQEIRHRKIEAIQAEAPALDPRS
jgi:small-conductance mechanosensitive channel